MSVACRGQGPQTIVERVLSWACAQLAVIERSAAGEERYQPLESLLDSYNDMRETVKGHSRLNPTLLNRILRRHRVTSPSRLIVKFKRCATPSAGCRMKCWRTFLLPLLRGTGTQIAVPTAPRPLVADPASPRAIAAQRGGTRPAPMLCRAGFGICHWSAVNGGPC